MCLISKCHRDPKVYGDSANEFVPERMLDEDFQRLPKGAWKPFGTGVRACIGRAFAWQESQMAVALLLQNFNLRLDDPSYEGKIKQTLTLKPEDFYMHASLRDGITATSLQASLTSQKEHVSAAVDETARGKYSGSGKHSKPMAILYGSNTGTCMSLAQKLSVEAKRQGYEATVMEMNAAVGVLLKDQPTVIITASYEGLPPDNAGHFVAWLESLQNQQALQGIQYAVFGCGHSDWATTYQRIPTLVDELLDDCGGERLVERGLCNAANGDIFSDFDAWSDHTFWPTIAPAAVDDGPTISTLDMEISTQSRGSYLRQDVRPGTVLAARCLTAAGQPEKRHLEVRLPQGMTYTAGDYLAVLPLNRPESVARVRRYFKLPQDATITIKSGAATFLPTNVSLSVTDLLQGFVELGFPATKKDIAACAAACKDTNQQLSLQRLADSGASADQRISLLDLLEYNAAIEMSFSSFLALLPPLRPRRYSISSSPLADPETCTITYGIIDEAAKSGLGRYVGVTGAYLASLRPGDEVSVSVRATNKFFHLPTDPESTPILMLGAGTGIAPFRGFIQERAEQIKAGRTLAPALMFMGCRSATEDRLYAYEFETWAKLSAVDIRYAFSRGPEASERCRYVQDRMLNDRPDIRRLWRQGAKVFTCGSPAVSGGVGNAALQILKEARAEQGEAITDEEAVEWFRKLRNERFVVDVFA